MSLILILYIVSFSFKVILEHNLENFGGTEKRWNTVWFVYQHQISIKHLFTTGWGEKERSRNIPLVWFLYSSKKIQKKRKKRKRLELHPAELAPHLLHRAAKPVDYNNSHQTCFARFVLHTSSLVSLSQGSRQVGHRFKDTAFWLSVRISSPPYTLFISFTALFLNFGGSSSRLPFCLSFELFSVFHLFFSLSFVSTSLSVSTPLSVARGSWLPCWCRYLMLWGPRAHRSWKSPFPPAVQPVGDKHNGLRLRC